MDLEKELTWANHDFTWAKHELETMRIGHAIVNSGTYMTKEAL